MLSTAAAAPYNTAVTPTLRPNRSGPQGLTPLGATRPDTVVSLTLLLRFPGVDGLRQYLAAQRAAAAR